VQRPDIRERIREDFAALEGFAELLERHSQKARHFELVQTVEELRRSIHHEMDYRLEARNLETIRGNLEGYDQILIPAPVHELSSARVLTMDVVRGQKATEIGRLGLLEVDGPLLVRQLFEAYLDQILVDGFFHADPHPGNVLLTEDSRIGLIDFGMVGRVPEPDRERLLRLLAALTEGRADEIARVARELGQVREGWNPSAFERGVADLVQRAAGASVAEIDVGRTLVELLRLSSAHGLSPNPDLCLVVKALLNLDAVAQALDPHFDPNAAMAEHAAELLRRHSLRYLRPGRVFGAMVEMQRLVADLPGRIDRLSRSLSEGSFTVRVDAFDEREMLDGIEKVANRIAVAVILAALILGASLLMRVQSSGPAIWGYPLLALLFFVVAAVGGLSLVARMAFERNAKRVERTGDGLPRR
jgi:predicted unusual protein kinase regulating ubiquinone biosynthesis (AarF/ABC1/UbiB family)